VESKTTIVLVDEKLLRTPGLKVKVKQAVTLFFSTTAHGGHWPPRFFTIHPYPVLV
jgi:hypothetical protein